MASLAVFANLVHSRRLLHRVPVRPLPPRQCTATTFSTLAFSHVVANCSWHACISESICVCVHVYICVCVFSELLPRSRHACIYVRVCEYVCLHIYIRMFVSIYVCMYICVCVCVWTFVCPVLCVHTLVMCVCILAPNSGYTAPKMMWSYLMKRADKTSEAYVHNKSTEIPTIIDPVALG